MINLSICIPTYNFGSFIGQTLDSIIPNLTDEVEVIILDGGSTDDTEQVVSQKQQISPQIHYHRQNYRGGIDRDLSKAISLASGNYCWPFSADDIMMPGAVNKLIPLIRSNFDIYLCEHTVCDVEMRPIKYFPYFINIKKPESFDLGNKIQRLRYFSQARKTHPFFGFLASVIFKRDLWERSAGIPDSFNDTFYGLAGRLLSLMPDGVKLQYLGEDLKLLYYRTGNDSFSEHGAVNRMRITVEGFFHLADKVFGEGSPEAFHIKRSVRNEMPLYAILSLKLKTKNSPQQESFEMLNKVVKQYYSNAGILNFCKYWIFILMPFRLLHIFACMPKSFRTVFYNSLIKI